MTAAMLASLCYIAPRASVASGGPLVEQVVWKRTQIPPKVSTPTRVKLVISDADQGVKAAGGQGARRHRQRCHVHFMCNALAHAGKSAGAPTSSFPAIPSDRQGSGRQPLPGRTLIPEASGFVGFWPRSPRLSGPLGANLLAYSLFK
jgi:hypothetical protein